MLKIGSCWLFGCSCCCVYFEQAVGRQEDLLKHLKFKIILDFIWWCLFGSTQCFPSLITTWWLWLWLDFNAEMKGGFNDIVSISSKCVLSWQVWLMMFAMDNDCFFKDLTKHFSGALLGKLPSTCASWWEHQPTCLPWNYLSLYNYCFPLSDVHIDLYA